MLNVGIFIFSLGYYIPKNFLKRKSYLKYCTLDNNKQLFGRIFNGKIIYHTNDIEKLIKLKNIDQVLLAIPSLSRKDRNKISQI